MLTPCNIVYDNSLVTRAAKHEETPGHKLHGPAGKHAAALRRLQGSETVCHQTPAAQGQP